jgi:glycosyltransferase involved in cell wall biosynthesis
VYPTGVRPRISIVTPSFNQARFIGRTVDSVLGQTGDFDLEYLVVDGASTDGTLDLLRAYGDRLRWISEKDAGQADAINKGLQRATGEILAWINSDDVLCPGALARVALAFAAHPGTEWLHGRCQVADEDDRVVRRWISLYKHVRCLRYSFDSLLAENYVSQMTVFWRRAAWDAVGPLDPSLRFAFDYDLWLKLARRGPPVYLGEAPLACFRWYETSKSGAEFGRQFEEDAAVTARYAGGRSWIMLRKRATNRAIVLAYRLLALGRALGGRPA